MIKKRYLWNCENLKFYDDFNDGAQTMFSLRRLYADDNSMKHADFD